MFGKSIQCIKRKAIEIEGKELPSRDELIDVIDEAGNVLEQRGFREVHNLGLLHRFCRVLLMNTQGEFILHTVGMDNKNIGKLDAPGGHLDAGETYEQAAIRELYEEMNVKLNESDLVFLGTIEDRSTPKYENMIGQAYLAIHDGPYAIEEDEIDAVYALSQEEMKRFTQTNPNHFTTKLLQTYKLWKQYREGK